MIDQAALSAVTPVEDTLWSTTVEALLTVPSMTENGAFAVDAASPAHVTMTV